MLIYNGNALLNNTSEVSEQKRERSASLSTHLLLLTYACCRQSQDIAFSEVSQI